MPHAGRAFSPVLNAPATADREALIKAMETRRQEAFSRPTPLAY